MDDEEMEWAEGNDRLLGLHIEAAVLCGMDVLTEQEHNAFMFWLDGVLERRQRQQKRKTGE